MPSEVVLGIVKNQYIVFKVMNEIIGDHLGVLRLRL